MQKCLNFSKNCFIVTTVHEFCCRWCKFLAMIYYWLKLLLNGKLYSIIHCRYTAAGVYSLHICHMWRLAFTASGEYLLRRYIYIYITSVSISKFLLNSPYHTDYDMRRLTNENHYYIVYNILYIGSWYKICFNVRCCVIHHLYFIIIGTMFIFSHSARRHSCDL